MKDRDKLNECNLITKARDIRRLSEEEFLSLTNQIKELTKNFTEFKQLIKEDSQILLIIRCLTGMKRKDFASAIGINEEILRQIEVGRREIKNESKIDKISKNLEEIFSKISEISVENALELFKEVAIPTDNEKVEKIRSELEEISLPEDLRKMDEEQFLKVFEWLKEKTNNFKIFPEEVFLAKNQLILILRCALGLTRSSFARKVGIFQETLRHVEAGRKGLQFSQKTVEDWCRKINEFLKTQEISPNIEKSLSIWKEISIHQTEENITEIEKIKSEMNKLGLIDWDKKDSKILPEFFNFFREKTNNFTIFPISLFLADSSLSIFFIRCCNGMTQKELAEKIGCTKDLIRHLENKHGRIVHAGPALRWINKLQALLPKNINFEKFEQNWKKIIFSKIENIEKKESFKSLSTEAIISKIEELKSRTNNFNEIREVLENDARNIFLFRVICRKRTKELARILKIEPSELRSWEDGKRRISPETLEKIAPTLKEMLRDIKIEKETILRNLKDIKKGKICFNKDIQVKNGIKLVEKLPPTELENKVIKVLSSNNIPFELHATIDFNGKFFNVDFAIPNSQKPKIIIEVFESKSSNRNLKTKLIVTDHRFVVLKSNKPDLKTAMIGETKSLLTEEWREHMLKEIIATDFIVLGDNEDVESSIKDTLLSFIKTNLQ